MSGFGSQPFGSSSYGLGEAKTAATRTGSLLRDVATGETRGSMLIDAKTRDYVLDANGQALGMPTTRQLVQIALATMKNSSAMRGLGIDFESIQVITPSLERQMDTALRDAVQHIVDQRLIEVIGTSMFFAGPDDGLPAGQVQTRFNYRELATGESFAEVL